MNIELLPKLCPNCGESGCDCRPSEKAMAASATESVMESAAESQSKQKWLETPFINASAVRRFLLEYADGTKGKTL